MVPGHGGIGWQIERVGQIVAGGKAGGLEVENGANKNDAVQKQPVPILQIAAEGGGAGGAIAFANQIFGRSPAAIAGAKEADKIPHAFDVFLKTVKFVVGFPRHRPAKASANWVNKNQIAFIQQGKLVFAPLPGRGIERTHISHLHAARPQQPQVHPHAAAAGAAVKAESDGALRVWWVVAQRVVAHISNKKEVGFGFFPFAFSFALVFFSFFF